MAEDTQQQTEEPKVDWNSAEEFFNGKPDAAGETPAADDVPKGDDTVEVRIKGRTVKMTKEAADAYNEFVRETRERDGRLGGEIAQLRERSARLEGMIETVNRAGNPAQADGDIKPPPPALAIENFEEWQRQFVSYHAAMMLRQQAELEGKYTSDQQQQRQQAQEQARLKAWADKFYDQNPHLNKPHLRKVVTNVYQEHHQEIDQLNAQDVEEAHRRLAELADAEIVAIKGDGKKIAGSTNTNRPPALEGSGTPSSGKAQLTPTKPMSAADWVARKRAELRGDKRK